MNPTYSLRPIEAADRPQVLALKCRAFEGLDPASEARRWEWEFEGNPAFQHNRPRGVLLECDGALAGSFAFVPMRVHLGSREGLALDGIDLMVAAEHRGQGLAHRLNEALWRERFCDFPFASGVNPASRHLFARAGARLLGGPEETLAHAWFLQDRPRSRLSGPACPVDQVDGFGQDADQLWADLRTRRSLCLVKDARYLNWRYRDFPFARPILLRAWDEGRLRGIAVLQEDARHGRWYLLEFLTPPGDEAAMRGLLGAVQERTRGSAHEAVFYATREAGQLPLLAEADFRPLPGDVPTFMGKLHARELCLGIQVTDWQPALGDGDQLYHVGDGGTR